jgi:hypothetical protein
MSVERISPSKRLVEILDEVLDKGITILDREVLLSLLGLELFVLEARVMVVSTVKYLAYAQAVGLIPLERRRHVTEYVSRDRGTEENPGLGRFIRWFTQILTRNRPGSRQS